MISLGAGTRRKGVRTRRLGEATQQKGEGTFGVGEATRRVGVGTHWQGALTPAAGEATPAAGLAVGEKGVHFLALRRVTSLGMGLRERFFVRTVTLHRLLDWRGIHHSDAGRRSRWS